MNLRLTNKHLTFSAAATLLVAALTACGGGGGGGDSDDPSIVYDGNRSAAVVDTGNAAELSKSAYAGGDDGAETGFETTGAVFESLATRNVAGSSNKTPASRTQVIALFAKSTMQSLIAGDATRSLARAPVTESDSFSGNCGGSASFTVTSDDETGEFSGQFRFDDFCEDNETVDGTFSFAAAVDIQTSEWEFSMDFGRLSIDDGIDSFTLSGDLSMSIDESFTHMVFQMNLVLRDNNTGETAWVNNLNMVMEDGAGYFDATVSGRYYDHELGYVDITTETPLRTFDGDEWPSSGSFVIEGANGGKARVTALSETTFQLEVDADGDNDYESLETLPWESIET